MQQLDLFGFPIETPAPKKKEKVAKAADVVVAPEQAQTETAAEPVPATNVDKEEITVEQEEIIPVIVAAIQEQIPVTVKTHEEIIPTPEPITIIAVEENKHTLQAEKVFVSHPVTKEIAAAEPLAAEKTITKKTVAPISKQAGKRGRKSFKEMDSEADLIEVPEDEILHQKLYYSISEVAGWFKVNTSLLRYWENEFDVLQPRKTRKGDRLFRVEDIKNLQLIYFLLRQRKFSIDGAKNYIKNNKQEADTQIRLVESLTRFRSFLLEMKASLQA